MPTFDEQLRDYLAPRFQLQEKLGSGGNGTVYLAYDTSLRREVAVKVIPHQDANAAAETRFKHEAWRLARLSHRNIVTIFDVAPEGSPFFYFIMERLKGETLDKRLTRRSLSRVDAVKLARDLLAALHEAHSHGIIHRDIKPSNVFLEKDRAVLTDFGVAKSMADTDTTVTKPGQVVGTARYMPPEQLAGRVVKQSDIYSIGAVLYESLTGEVWPGIGDLEAGKWSAVPNELRPVLRKALAYAPEDRWRSAKRFERALRPRRADRRATVGVSLIAVAIVWAIVRVWWLAPVYLRLERLRIEGAGAPAGVGDSLAQHIVHQLSGFPDFNVTGSGMSRRAKVVASGTVRFSDAALDVRVDLTDHAPVVLSTDPGNWRRASDLVADSLLLRLFSRGSLDSQLPVRVLPRGASGLQAFLGAERELARAWWDSAYVAYREAFAIDSSCVLCAWRHAEVGRFLSQPNDTSDAMVYRAHLDQFPTSYQALIRAELVPLRARLDSLRQAADKWPKFLFGPFRLGDETIHRGPLIGRPRREASVYFQRAVEVRRDFAPAWEHLLWLWIAEGNERQAAAALDTLRSLVPTGSPTTAIRDLLQGAFAWRFLPAALAARLTDSIIGPARERHEPLAAGARYLNAFDAQQGSVWLGARLDSADDHRESALLAQMLGYLALGQPERSRQILARLHTEFGDETIDLFGMELDAMLMMFDADSVRPSGWKPVQDRLREFAQRAPADLRGRAQWMAALLGRRFGDAEPRVTRDAPVPLAALVAAVEESQRGNVAGALTHTDPLTEIESDSAADPFFRTALHLMRAEWEVRRGQAWTADRELLWYENTDIIEFPSGSPQPSEVDWAFGVLARWRRARLGASDADLCSPYQDVARLWKDGEPRYAARADSSRLAGNAHGCPTSPTIVATIPK